MLGVNIEGNQRAVLCCDEKPSVSQFDKSGSPASPKCECRIEGVFVFGEFKENGALICEGVELDDSARLFIKIDKFRG